MGNAIQSMIGRVHPRIAVVMHDLLIVWLAWNLAYLLRYSFWPGSPAMELFSLETVLVLGAQGLVMWFFGLYRGLWRFASVPDLLNILKAGVAGTLVIVLILFLFNRLEGVPRSVFVIYPIALVLGLGTPRLLYRFWKDSRLDLGNMAPPKRVLILGAGRSGEMLIRDMRRESAYLPVGFLDDNEKLRGAKIHGVSVLGTIDELQRLAREAAAEILVIAMPSASNAQMQRVVEHCEDSGIPFRTLPRLQDMVTGRARFGDLKDVMIEDLLGRDPITLDWSSIRAGTAGRSVLVTGGGGSIGSELCRQLARLRPASLIVMDNSEYNLYRIDHEMDQADAAIPFTSVLGDVCDQAAVDRIIESHAPQIIFHAAAYKQVPLLQFQTREALRNNVLGTQVLAQAAVRHGVESFVLISTDKAVNPVNVMGASKRIAEIFCQNLSRHSGTRFITVRFGNVLDSAGSVVPLFREQIAAGGPVTVTHPEISRYFMTIPEACQLILQAAVMGQGGEIYVLDMGEPVKIRFLAEQMIRLAGKHPEDDVPIIYTGLRPGEKLFEELFHEHEQYRGTSHEQILLSRHREVDWTELTVRLDSLAEAIATFDESGMQAELAALVPEMGADSGPPDDNVIPLPRRQA